MARPQHVSRPFRGVGDKYKCTILSREIVETSNWHLHQLPLLRPLATSSAGFESYHRTPLYIQDINFEYAYHRFTAVPRRKSSGLHIFAPFESLCLRIVNLCAYLTLTWMRATTINWISFLLWKCHYYYLTQCDVHVDGAAVLQYAKIEGKLEDFVPMFLNSKNTCNCLRGRRRRWEQWW